MTLHIQADPAAVSKDLAEWLTTSIEDILKTQDRCTWVLTGGNSPKALYALLATDAYKNRIDWSKLHIFWGDERAVPFTDERNNARMTYEHLLDKVPVNREQVHIMRTDIDPEDAAREYEKILHNYFGDTGKSFDLVLSGMGDDGHTLSLFPGTAVIHEQQAWVKAFYLEPQQMFRITLTAPVVNRAGKVIFLAFGTGKARALKEVIEGAPNADLYPSQVIQPDPGELHWFVDEAAVKDLEKR
ncbi:MAG: 6-phosphogluconolactonase [Chitinophagaceae bacterium]|nr:6-phosphogluconolactonase [Chitinophagaceae bacterium]MCW5925893.1 6-phosphogluconolactonase [Chitinophagaceae bacterium]